jgi:hypothetical protein
MDVDRLQVVLLGAGSGAEVGAIRFQPSDGDTLPSSTPPPSPTPHGLRRSAPPNHPEYPANHSCVTISFAVTIDHPLGPAHFSVSLPRTPASTQLRHYGSSTELITEIANARNWDGVHFRCATDTGTTIGRALATYDHRHALQPDDD